MATYWEYLRQIIATWPWSEVAKIAAASTIAAALVSIRRLIAPRHYIPIMYVFAPTATVDQRIAQAYGLDLYGVSTVPKSVPSPGGQKRVKHAVIVAVFLSTFAIPYVAGYVDSLILTPGTVWITLLVCCIYKLWRLWISERKNDWIASAAGLRRKQWWLINVTHICIFLWSFYHGIQDGYATTQSISNVYDHFSGIIKSVVPTILFAFLQQFWINNLFDPDYTAHKDYVEEETAEVQETEP